jgi:hypothetical protein
MIRSLYPTDLLSFLFFSRQALPNQAIARDNPGERSLFSPQVFLERWLPLGCTRDAWVMSGGARIRGAVSIKSCCSPSVWQVDRLQAGDEECCIALLDIVSAAAATRGVRRIFLRLPSASSLIDGARHSGFSCYGTDYLCRYGDGGGQWTTEVPEPYLIRPRSIGDEHALFQLYNATVPLQVRTVEGMTLEDWQECRGRSSWPAQHRELVLQKQDNLVGWLRINSAGGTGCFEIMFHQLEEDVLRWLANYGLTCLRGKSQIFCVALSFQGQLLELLERIGFEQVAEYSALSKEIAISIKEPQVVPIEA